MGPPLDGGFESPPDDDRVYDGSEGEEGGLLLPPPGEGEEDGEGLAPPALANSSGVIGTIVKIIPG